MHTQQSNVLKMCFLMSRYYTLKMLCVTIMIHMLEILLNAYESKPIGDGNKLKTIIDFFLLLSFAVFCNLTWMHSSAFSDLNQIAAEQKEKVLQCDSTCKQDKKKHHTGFSQGALGQRGNTSQPYNFQLVSDLSFFILSLSSALPLTEW